MRVEKFVLVMTITGILISGTVIAVFANTVIQQSAPIQISVQTDKPYYAAGEAVTFKLIDDTPNIKFSVNDPQNGPQRITTSMGEINIVKLPDYIDPSNAISDLSRPEITLNYNKSIRTDATYVATIHYGTFSNKASPLSLSWDGMIRARDVFFDNGPLFPATAGFYAIVPNFLYATDHLIHFNMDEGAIFYYDGLHAGIDITNIPDSHVTIKLNLGTPPGTTGNMTSGLYTDFEYTDSFTFQAPNRTIPNSHHYHNQSLVLTSGADTKVDFTIDVKIPSHGDPMNNSMNDATFQGASFQFAYFYAMLVTPEGNYTFGLNGIWNGGWKSAQQY